MRNSNITTISHIVSVWNHVSKYKSLVNDFVNLAYHKGYNILHLLAKDGNEEVIRLILEKIDQDKLSEVINTTDRTGLTPLYYAIIDDNLEVVKFLIEKGAELIVNEEYSIHCAAMYGSLKILKYFFDQGYFQLDESDGMCEDCLTYAIKHDQLSIIKYLIGEDVSVDSLDDDEIMHLFYYAFEPGSLDIAQYLVRNLNGVNLRSEGGESLLHYAAMYGSSDIVEYLVQNGANVNLPDHDGKSPLYYAATSGNLDIVKYLLENGANVNLRDENIIALLFCAVKDGILTVVKCLVEIGVDIDQCDDRHHRSPLHYAAMNGYLNIVEKLIEEGANVNACDKYGESPLHYAARMGYFDVVIHLVKSKADINLCDECSKKPLHYSIENNHLNITDYLRVQEDNVNPAHEQSQVSMRKRPRVSELQYYTLPYSVNCQCVSSKRGRLENVRVTSLDDREDVNPSLDTTTSLIALKFKLQHVLSCCDDKMQRFTQFGNNDSREPQQPVDNSVPISSLSGIVIEPGNNKVSVQPSGIRDDKLLYCSH